MELPEMMWKKLETGNISQAAQIQQLGFHVHLGLSVESGAHGTGNVQKWFPIISRQRVTLSSFNEVIIRESTAQLKAVQLSLERASDSASALILLRGDSSLEMLSEFLKLRSETARTIALSQTGAKQQLQNFLQFLVSSMAALHALFVGKSLLADCFFSVLRINTWFCNIFAEGFPDSKLPQGLLVKTLKSVCQTTAESTIHLLPVTKGLVRQLPPIITDYRYRLQDLRNDHL